jgi:hypothetical protein
MTDRINWAAIVSTVIFFFVQWLLQSNLSTLYERVETTCGIATCGEKIAIAYQLLSLSTVITAAALAWVAYRINRRG